MLNSFQRFGIKHLSPSSLNSFEYDRGKWALSYLFGVKEDKPMFWRGKAVETGFDALLRGRSFDEAVAAALMNFDLNAGGEISDEIVEESNKIAPMVCQLVPVAKSLGVPVAKQLKVEHYLSGVEVPFLMFLDFVFEDHIIELKTSERCAVTASHKRQGALYSDAKDMPVSILCVTDKKHILHPLSEEEKIAALDDVRDIVDSITATIANRTPVEVLRACRLGERTDDKLKEARKRLLMQRPTSKPTVDDLYGP